MNDERTTPGSFAANVLAAGSKAEAKCRELLKQPPAPPRLPVDDEHCYLCHQTGDMYPVCEDDLDHAACFDAMEMDLRYAAMEVLRLLPRMKEAGVPGLIRGKLCVVFENHLKAYLSKPLAEEYEAEVTEKVLAGLDKTET